MASHSSRARAIGVLCVVLSTALSACTGGGSTGSAGTGAAAAGTASNGGGNVTLTYWENVLDDGGLQDSVIKSFETSHPNVKVNHVTMQLNDLTVKLPTALSSGTGPDVIYADVSPAFLGDYVKAKEILPLDNAFKTYGWDKRVFSFAQKRATYGGHIYAVGNEVEDLGLMVNKKIFDALHLPLPTTFDQLESDMATIKAKSDYTPMQLACASGCYNGFHVMHTIAYATMPTATVVNTTPQGTGSYLDPGWLAALTTFQSWVKAGYFNKDANAVGFDNHWADFCAGKVAMLTQGTWLFKTISDCAKASGGRLDFVNIPFPVKQGLPFQAYVGVGSGWYVNAAVAKDPAREKAALDLINAMIAPSVADQWVSKAQVFPAVPFDKSKVTLTAPQKVALDILEKAGDNGGPVPVGFNNSSAESDIWAAGLQGIIAGSTTPQQLVTKLQAELTKEQAAWRHK